jgi:class 4 POU domain transcription factor
MQKAMQPMGLHPPPHLQTANTFPGRYSPPYPHRSANTFHNMDTQMRRMPQHGGICNGNIFGGLDDSLLARAEALAAADISKASSPPIMKPDSLYGHAGDMGGHNPPVSRSQMPLHGFSAPGDSMLDQVSLGMTMPLGSIGGTPDHSGMSSHHPSAHQMYSPVYSHATNGMNPHHGITSHHPHAVHHSDTDCDPRELEAFAEHFKQRRIKLGVTQNDVGSALGKLKLPGVGSLSQSTICRFESLTLSHNNMIALKPVLQAWLEEAEKNARDQKNQQLLDQCGDKKRKRTSIAAPEKRSLEAYFAVQPRPSGEKIAQIAEKLDLKKNVVRVWFCNQRQKQKRMKFSATMQGGGGTMMH